MNAVVVRSENCGGPSPRPWAIVLLALALIGTVAWLPPCFAQTFEVVHTFVLGDGYWPMAPVTFDRSGNLYGTTLGGARGTGSLYEINRKGKEKVLHFFRNAEGTYLESAPFIDSAGNIYGTASEGAQYNVGSVFEYTAAGTVVDLVQFGGEVLGGGPWSGLVRGASGNLYGITQGGGIWDTGVIYEIDHATGAYTVLHTFGPSPDGCCSQGPVLVGLDGNLYGTLNGFGAFGFGAIFKLDMSTGIETILHDFTNGNDGGFPNGNLAQDAAGNLYGTTYQGGSVNYGTIFKLDLTTNTLTTLWNFYQDGTDGANPYAGPVIDQAGNLYGTTQSNVYEFTQSGQYIDLHGFTGGSDGSDPWAGVTLHGGSVYGTTPFGGDPYCNCGVVFKITP